MSRDCEYLCGSKYASKQYSRKLLEKIDPVVEDYKNFVHNLAYMCSSGRTQSRLIVKSTDVSVWYTPGVAKDLIPLNKGGYSGPSVYVEVETQFTDKETKCFIDKAFTYVVQLNGLSYKLNDSQFYRSSVDTSDPKQRDTLDSVNMLYSQIGLYDYSKFDKHLHSRIQEFRQDMKQKGTESLLYS